MNTLDFNNIQEIDEKLYSSVSGGGLTYVNKEKIPGEYSYYIGRKDLYPDSPELPSWPKPD